MSGFHLLCLVLTQAALCMGYSDFQPCTRTFYRQVQKYSYSSYLYRYNYCKTIWGVRYCRYYKLGTRFRQNIYYGSESYRGCCADYGGSNCNIRRVRIGHVFPSVVDEKPSLKVSWLPIGTSNITYKIHYTSSTTNKYETVTKPHTDPCTVLENLVKSTRYHIQVAAMYGGQVGPYSTTADGSTYADPPHPENVVLQPREQPGELTVSWSLVPAAPTFASVLGYLVQYQDLQRRSFLFQNEVSEEMKWLKSSYTFTGLIPGSTYKVRVGTYGAMNSRMYGAAMNVTIYDVPGAILHIESKSFLRLNGSLCLHFSWAQPHSDSPIHNFHVSYRKVKDRGWIDTSVTTTSFTMDGLNISTVYKVKVCAESNIGRGECSIATARTPSVPATVKVTRDMVTRIIHKERGSLRPALKISWPTAESDLPIDQYQIQFRIKQRSNNSLKWTTLNISSNSTQQQLSNLEHDTIYEVRIRAFSKLGAGDWSRIVSKSTDTIECCRKCLSTEKRVVVTFETSVMSVPLSRAALVEVNVYRYGTLREELTIRVEDQTVQNVSSSDYYLLRRELYFKPNAKAVDKASFHIVLHPNNFLNKEGMYSIFLLLQAREGEGETLAFGVSEMTLNII